VSASADGPNPAAGPPAPEPAPEEMPFDQRIARVAAARLGSAGLTPNGATGVSLLFGLGAALLFATGGRVETAAAGALFMLALWGDHLDGELARATGRASRFGHWFDRAVSAVNMVAVFLGIGLGAAAGAGDDRLAIAGAVAGVAVAAVFALRLRTEVRFGAAAVRRPVRRGFEAEDVMYVVGPLAWADPWLDVLGPFVAVAAVGGPVYLALTLIRASSRKIRAAD